MANYRLFFLLLRVRSHCVNTATIQPLVTVVMMFTKMSIIVYAPSTIRRIDARDRCPIYYIVSIWINMPISYENKKVTKRTKN